MCVCVCVYVCMRKTKEKNWMNKIKMEKHKINCTKTNKFNIQHWQFEQPNDKMWPRRRACAYDQQNTLYANNAVRDAKHLHWLYGAISWDCCSCFKHVPVQAVASPSLHSSVLILWFANFSSIVVCMQCTQQSYTSSSIPLNNILSCAVLMWLW